MHFSLVECGTPPLSEQFLGLVLFLGPVLGAPLLLWLRWRPRNALDVLGSAVVTPPSTFQRVLDFTGWLLLATPLLILAVLATAHIHASMFLRYEEPFFALRKWSVDPSWGQVAAAVLVCSGCFIHWLRTFTSERDVLRAGTRT
jgi:amino acid transporter